MNTRHPAAHSALVGTLVFNMLGLPLPLLAESRPTLKTSTKTSATSHTAVQAGPAVAGEFQGRFSLADALTGARVGAENLAIRIFRDGRLTKQGRTSADGDFRVDGLTSGIYSIVAAGPDGFYASSHRVSSSGGSRIDATVVHPANVPAVAKLIREQLGPSRRSQSLNLGMTNPAPVAEAAVGISQTPILKLSSQGQLRIRANGLRSGNGAMPQGFTSTLSLLQGGSVVGQAKCDGMGLFELSGIVPGEYSLVILTKSDAAGGPLSPGVVAFGVSIEAAPAAGDGVVKGSSKDDAGLVSTALLQDPGINNLNGIDSVPSENVPPLDGPPPTEIVGEAPPAFGGGGGGFGGGVGGGGGGGGLGGGGLLGALGLGAGLAGLGVALANDNNNGGSNVPASPSIP